jgi:ubiquinone/menaquinone biosynthesis C-methylase UbiE
MVEKNHWLRYRGPDEKERRKWQDPESILQEIGLRPGVTFIDVGCGEGFFALPAARLAGEKGKVFGLDINPRAIRRLRSRGAKEGLTNLHLSVGQAEDTVLCESCADIVFFGTALHDFDNPDRVVANAWKMLRPGGKLADVDWKKKPMGLGPPMSIRFSEAKARSILGSGGFKVVSSANVGHYHYLIIAEKQ